MMRVGVRAKCACIHGISILQHVHMCGSEAAMCSTCLPLLRHIRTVEQIIVTPHHQTQCYDSLISL